MNRPGEPGGFPASGCDDMPHFGCGGLIAKVVVGGMPAGIMSEGGKR